MVTLALLLTLGAAEPACAPEMTGALDRLDGTLTALETELDDVTARAVRKRLRRKLLDARRAARHVRDEACDPQPGEAAPSAAVPTGPSVEIQPPLQPRLFNALLGSVLAEPHSADRLQVLEAGVVGQCVTSVQASKLLAAFTFEADRMRAAGLLVPRVSDRERAFTLTASFDFANTKKKLKSLIVEVPPVPDCSG
jgi:hypothetical protein